MDEAFFINRDARLIASELQQGDAANAACRLREDCAHMNPGEFSSLLRQTKANEMPGNLSDIALYRNGQVTVRSQDGSQQLAGQLPPREMAALLPPPPPPIVEVRPPVVELRPPYYGPPGYCPPEPHRMWVPPGREHVVVPLNNTVVDTVGGLIAGSIIDRKHPGTGAALGGIIGFGVGTALDNSQK
jgi:hypothetical protein